MNDFDTRGFMSWSILAVLAIWTIGFFLVWLLLEVFIHPSTLFLFSIVLVEVLILFFYKPVIGCWKSV